MPFWNVGTTSEILLQSLSNVTQRIEAAREGKIMKAIRKATVTFELCQNQERAVHVCERLEQTMGYVRMLIPHALKTTCHTHVHCDNYIPVCQANPSKVTIHNFSRLKIRMACETNLE